jgi:hypothetical protein
MVRRAGWLIGLLTGLVTSAAGCSGSGSSGQFKRVFATRAGFPGNFGGLTAADTQCNNFAAAAAVGGTWKAWLSDSATNALDRIIDVGPWTDMKGARIFRDKTQLMGFPEAAVTIDETGQRTARSYWTGTLLGGTKSTYTCSDWTSNAINAAGTTGASGTDIWTDGGTSPCSSSYALLCLEQ